MADNVVTVFEAQTEEYKQKLNDLVNSVDKLGAKEQSQLAKSRVAINKNVAALEEEKRKLKELEDLQKKAFTTQGQKHFQKEIDTSKLKIQQLNAEIKLSQKNITDLGNKALPATNKLGGSMGGLLTTARSLAPALGLAFGAFEAVNITKEAVKMAAGAEGVRRAFEALNKPDLLDNLRDATRGTVTDIELMTAAVNARNFQVPLERLPKFFEFARQRARDTGKSVDYLVNSIIDGIGRKSSLVLDNLGISATELQEELKKTGDFGQAAANIIERELAKTGKQIDTDADKIARLNVFLENTKLAFGEALLDTLNAAEGNIEGLTGSIDNLSSSLGELTGQGEGFNLLGEVVNLAGKQIGLFVDFVNATVQTIGLLVDAGVAVKNTFAGVFNIFANLGTIFKDFDFTSPIQSFKELGNKTALVFKQGFSETIDKDIFSDALDATKLGIDIPVTITEKGKTIGELKAELKGLVDSLDGMERGSQELSDTLKKIGELENVINKALGKKEDVEKQKTAMQRLNEEIAKMKAALEDLSLQSGDIDQTFIAEYVKKIKEAEFAQKKLTEAVELFKNNQRELSAQDLFKLTELQKTIDDIKAKSILTDEDVRKVERLETAITELKKGVKVTVDTEGIGEQKPVQIPVKLELDDSEAPILPNVNLAEAVNEDIKKINFENFKKKLEEIVEVYHGLATAAQIFIDIQGAGIQSELENLDIRSQKILEIYDAEEQALQEKLSKGEISESLANKKRVELEQARAAQQEQIRKKENELKTKQAQQEKAATLIRMGQNLAEAITKTIASTGFFGIALSGFVAGLIAYQIAKVAATPVPQYAAKGDPYVTGTRRSKRSKGSDTIDYVLTKGERVTTAEQNKKYWNVYNALENPNHKYQSIFEAIEKGKLEDYVQNIQIAPTLHQAKKTKEKEQRTKFAKAIVKNVKQEKINYYELRRIMQDEGLHFSKGDLDYLIKGISKEIFFK